MTAITREWLSRGDYSDKSEKGRGLLEEILTNAACSRILLTSIVAVSEYYVCGTPVRSNVRKSVQTVPRRIKLSRAGMPFSKISNISIHNLETSI